MGDNDEIVLNGNEDEFGIEYFDRKLPKNPTNVTGRLTIGRNEFSAYGHTILEARQNIIAQVKSEYEALRDWLKE